MTETFKPETEAEVIEAVRWAQAHTTTLDIRGHASKSGLGKPVSSSAVLDMSAMNAITLYEPEELVMRARAGTPMSDIETALDAENQMLAFEPWSGSSLYGREGGTIAGIIACNSSGPRRILTGAARDHILGFQGVNGLGQAFKSGGRVVKNVTGFDVSKLMAGAMGTLGVMSEVTFKVAPKPQCARTVLLFGVTDVAAALIAAQGSAHTISAAAHLPRTIAARSHVACVRGARADVTAVRIEGPAPSVAARSTALRELLAPFAQGVEDLHDVDTKTLWTEIRDVAYFAPHKQIWRICVAPSEGPGVAQRLSEALGGETLLDWAGGLIWLALAPGNDAHAPVVRAAFTSAHATCMRAADDVRAAIDVFQPQSPALEALTRRIRESFDPSGIFNPGRV